MDNRTNDSKLTPVTFARLPIFDAKRRLWGYELVYTSADGERTICSKTGNVITADLMSGTSLALEQTMDRDKKIMVNFSRKISWIIFHIPFLRVERHSKSPIPPYVPIL